MEITPEQASQLYSDFSSIKHSASSLKYHELIVKLISENRSLGSEIESLEKKIHHLKRKFYRRQVVVRYMENRLIPPPIKNPYGLEPGKTFSCDNHYGNCIVVVTGIVQKYSCGQWHELFEYQVTCKSHDGLDTYINFGAAAHLGFLNAQYFLDMFSKEF